MVTFSACSSCGVSHLAPVPCGLSYMERLRSVEPHGSVLETRTKRKMWDQEAVSDQFGSDARERMLEETDGIGYVKMVDGVPHHRHHRTGEVEQLSERQLDQVMLGGKTEQLV